MKQGHQGEKSSSRFVGEGAAAVRSERSSNSAKGDATEKRRHQQGEEEEEQQHGDGEARKVQQYVREREKK